MIDARSGFAKDGAKNRLREQDIRRVFDAWETLENLEVMVTLMIKRKPYLILPDSYLTPKLPTSEMIAISMCHVI